MQRCWKKIVSHVEGCIPQEVMEKKETTGNYVIPKKGIVQRKHSSMKGKKYISLGQCCEIYGINESSVTGQSMEDSLHMEDAVKHFIEKSSVNKLEKDICI